MSSNPLAEALAIGLLIVAVAWTASLFVSHRPTLPANNLRIYFAATLPPDWESSATPVREAQSPRLDVTFQRGDDGGTDIAMNVRVMPGTIWDLVVRDDNESTTWSAPVDLADVVAATLADEVDASDPLAAYFVPQAETYAVSDEGSLHILAEVAEGSLAKSVVSIGGHTSQVFEEDSDGYSSVKFARVNSYYSSDDEADFSLATPAYLPLTPCESAADLATDAQDIACGEMEGQIGQEYVIVNQRFVIPGDSPPSILASSGGVNARGMEPLGVETSEAGTSASAWALADQAGAADTRAAKAGVAGVLLSVEISSLVWLTRRLTRFRQQQANETRAVPQTRPGAQHRRSRLAARPPAVGPGRWLTTGAAERRTPATPLWSRTVRWRGRYLELQIVYPSRMNRLLKSSSVKAPFAVGRPRPRTRGTRLPQPHDSSNHNESGFRT
ncbi:hypothetical protein BD833_11212 [Blastococcus xanthinilyticus]|uniref:Uncharacterized protein n=1 Tax=Blastococcus xanthinilyticus TaxID=1564164 RepID=A0A5S5CSB9_9ACTN|nr:hypothetical protein BD833_11212 [Blastococcus xanthinilyticus]